MAKLVFEAAEIYSDSGYSTLIGRIEGVRTDDLTLDKEGNVVTIDNGREINEFFTGNVELMSRNTDFEASAGGSSDGNAILSDAHVSTDGTTPTESFVKLVGRSNSHDLNWGACFINGRENYSNGRLETMLSFSLEEVDESDVATSATATGS